MCFIKNNCLKSILFFIFSSYLCLNMRRKNKFYQNNKKHDDNINMVDITLENNNCVDSTHDKIMLDILNNNIEQITICENDEKNNSLQEEVDEDLFHEYIQIDEKNI
jgi:hypothetical protein